MCIFFFQISPLAFLAVTSVKISHHGIFQLVFSLSRIVCQEWCASKKWIIRLQAAPWWSWGAGGGVSCVVLFFLMSYRSRLMFTKRTSLRRVCTFAEYQLGTTTKRHGKISKNVDRNCSSACLQMSGWLEGSPFHKLQGLRGPFSDIFFPWKWMQTYGVLIPGAACDPAQQF